MTLDSRHLLACVIALVPSGVRVLHALGVHDTAAGLLFPSIALPGRANRFFKDLLQNGILTWARPLAPLPEILVAGAPIGEVRGQHSPLAPAFQEVQHPAENVVQVHGAGLGPASGRLQHGQNPGELLPADVAGIGMRHDYPSPDDSLSLTYFRDRRQALRGRVTIGFSLSF